MSHDDDARIAIRERLHDTMLVEAGAGTGKTSALVDRVVALVASGIRIERIAAITFTERAAAELRDRVRSGLEEAQGGACDLIVSGLCQKALEGLDRAQLSTIHSFAQSLLRAYAAEAGVDPELTVLDDLAAGLRFEERWRAALEHMHPDGPEGRAVDRALGLGLRIDGLRGLARRLQERADIAADVVASPPSCPPPDWDALPRLRAAVAAVPLGRAAGDDPCALLLVDLGEALDALSAVDGLERESLLASTAHLHGRNCGRLGNLPNWGGDRTALNDARDTADAVSGSLGAMLARARADALAGLLPPVARLMLDEAAARRRDGALVFDDLILWARDLLRDSPSARAALRARYDALLIDEFQDTDPWQASIAASFARDPADERLGPGRLFLVGDPKQSIYRFRRADMAVYAAEEAAVRAEGGLIETLRTNRRTRDVILDWVNDVFDELIGAGDDPALQPRYAPVDADRSADLRGPGVAWMGAPMPPPARAWQMRMEEASDVAATCRAAVADTWEVQERDGTVRPARLGDIAVLIPTRTGLSAIEAALREAGVAYRVEGGSLVYRTQELRDLLNRLTAIDDPSDEVAVVAALRGPGAACSDRELAEHRARGMRFNYLAPGLDGPGPVEEGLRRLRDHHRERHDRPLATTVERVVAEMQLVEAGILHTRTRDSYRRARFVVEQARAFEREGPQSLRAFVGWMEERTRGPVLDRDGSGLDDDEDAVRVLTVHAAKGLEFPIVVLAGIGTRPQPAGVPAVSEHAGALVAAVGTKAGGRLELGDVAGAEARETAHRDAEAARLLYVATTRARDHLVVSLHHLQKSGGGSGASRLMGVGAHDLAGRWEPPPAPAGAAAGPLAGLAVDLPDDPSPAAHAAARADLVRGAARVRFTSATGIASAIGERREEGDEPWSRGRGGTRVGRAVHAAVQSLPLTAGPDEIAAVATAQAVAEAVPDRAGEVAGLVGAALASEAAARARAAGGGLREVPFAMTFDGAVVEGFIDLVVPTATGLEIIDWKTDDVPPLGVADRLAGYRLQAGLYAAGLTRATGRVVERITYVFLRAGVEVSPGEPAALAAAADEILTRDGKEAAASE